MANSLLTGVSGLVTHQRMLDVIGNNLANLNTTAYKSQRLCLQISSIKHCGTPRVPAAPTSVV